MAHRWRLFHSCQEISCYSGALINGSFPRISYVQILLYWRKTKMSNSAPEPNRPFRNWLYYLVGAAPGSLGGLDFHSPRMPFFQLLYRFFRSFSGETL
jgi:hypothetical protein